MAHRLSGAAFAVTPELRRLLGQLSEAPLTPGELLRIAASAAARDTLDILAAAGLLLGEVAPAKLLDPWLGHRWLKPLANPSLLVHAPGAAARLLRPDRLDLCRLPRRPPPPRLVEEAVPEDAARLLAATSDGLSLGEALERLDGTRSGHRSAARALRALDFLTDPRRQLGRVAPAAADPLAPAPWHALQQSFEHDGGGAGGSELSGRRFYDSEVSDPEWNFDWGETTVSHAFRQPTEALAGSTYGGRFAEVVLAELVELPRRPLRVLEVGGGLGHFARDFAGELGRRLPHGLRYRICDCSPALIAHQQRLLRSTGIEWTPGDAEHLAVRGRFDVIVANEMIADLRIEPQGSGRPARPAGALEFVGRLAGRLTPGGQAYLVEYGGLDRPPLPVEHLDHPEHSVDFRPLLEAAAAAGLRAELEPLGDFLGLLGEAEMLCGQQEHLLCLRRLLAGGTELPAYAAYDRQSFLERWGHALRGVTGVEFAPLDRRWHFGPPPGDFLVLKLARPGAARANR